MFDLIIHWSLKNRWIVLLASILLIFFGIRSVKDTSLDVFPEFAPTQVIVQTEMAGMTPEEVENLITIPLENALNGTPKTESIRSFSTPGLSAITVVFDWGTDPYLARQLVSEKLQAASSRLPTEAKPVINPISTPVGNVLIFAFTSAKNDKTSFLDLRTLVDWTVRQRLLAVSGVANLSVYGGEIKQYQVLVDPIRLKQFDISLSELENALQNSNLSVSGGYIIHNERELLVKPQSRLLSLEDLSNSVVKSSNGTPITLGQLAEIKIGNALKRGDGNFNGDSAVILQVYKRPGTDTLKITKEVEKALDELKDNFPKDIKIHKIYDQSDYIISSVNNVRDAIRDGAILVIIILFLFLWNWRTSLISLTAIPLSVLTALLILKQGFGQSINVMTLGGLAIALGEVVDDAVIDVENVYKKLRENQTLSQEQRKSTFSVIFEASKEIRSSVVFATIIVILVFLPIFTLGSIEGELFKPLGYAYITSVGASLLVALTVTPALCYLFFSRQKDLPHTDPPFVIKLKIYFKKIFDWSLKNTRLVFLSISSCFLLSCCLIVFMGKGFLPELGEKNLMLITCLKPGVSLEKNAEIGRKVQRVLLKIKGVKAIGQRVGRSVGDDEPLDSNTSHFDIAIDPRLNDSQARKVVEEIREKLNNIPGLATAGGSFLTHAIEEVISGVRAQVAIKIFGSNSEILQEKAEKISEILKSTKGAVDVQIESIIQTPQIKIEINRANAARYGLNSGDIAKYIEIALNGREVSRIYEGSYSFPVYLWFINSERKTISTIKNFLIDTPSGAKIPLIQVAEIQEIKSPNAIKHDNLSRRLAVSSNVQDRDVVSFVNEVKKKIKKEINLPNGYYITYGGEYEAQTRASQQMGFLISIVLLGILAILTYAFRSFLKALLIMLNLPLALIGGVFALFLSGQELDIASLIGFVTLFGISTRNGIMLVSSFEKLENEHPEYNSLQVITEGTLDRLVPVLITALCAALAMLPLALFPGSGKEIEHPLAIVILGGMFTSTSLTLLIIPLGYLWLKKREEKR